MAFNLQEFKLDINLLTAAGRVLLRDGSVNADLMTIDVLPCDHIWYRLVTKGTLVSEGVSYNVGLHKMEPTEGGTFKYSAAAGDLSYIDIHPGVDNIIKSVTVFTNSRDITAALPYTDEDGETIPGSTVVIVHHYAEIIGEDGYNMKPMFVLDSGETIHVNTLDGQIVAAFEFE